MLHILNAGQPWIGRPVRALPAGNRRPVALADTLSLLVDSPATQVIVLGNDFDPEGGAITVISASAALGSVTINPDQTLSYTPPPAYVGPDTITYTIADDQGQTHSANVGITVSAPTLSITIEPGNTLTVNAELGTISVTITTPATLAGTYSADTGDLTTGPVNLVPPVISGTPDLGEVLSTTEGLWIYDTAAATPTQSWQWRRDGVDIAGATGATYTVQAADANTALSVVETLTDAFGARAATSAPVGSVFTPAADTALSGWWDASDTATITHFSGEVSGWTDKAGGADMVQTFGVQRPLTNTRSLNGLNVLDFDGGKLMESARIFPASGDLAIHMALVIDSTSNLYEAVLAVEATNDFQIDANSSIQFDGRLNASGIGTTTTLSGGPFVGAVILSAVFDYSGAASAEIFIGNASRGVMAYTTPVDVTAALHIMTNRSKNAWVDGAVAEVIVTGDVTNRTQHHDYLSAKWGIV